MSSIFQRIKAIKKENLALCLEGGKKEKRNEKKKKKKKVTEGQFAPLTLF